MFDILFWTLFIVLGLIADIIAGLLFEPYFSRLEAGAGRRREARITAKKERLA